MAIDVLGLAQQVRVTRKLLYAQASAALRADLEAIHKRHDQARSAIYQAHRRRPWADWLKQQATGGDGQARSMRCAPARRPRASRAAPSRATAKRSPVMPR
ncbi:hypothetical protein [Verminephrobacter eiseniae]|uniref:hypothetical protein n=1 Tax=Verminephrobacter eiseniae TaxID=364317 RepID=UPI0038B26299